MPRFTTPTALALLNQQTGTEPYYILAVNWVGGTVYYSSRNMPGTIYNIMELGTLRNERRSDSYSNAGSVRVKLSDTDNLSKYLIDNAQLENAPAALYLAFNNTSQADWVPLLTGKTVGPLIWDEATRTFEFSVESIIHNLEIGYAATYADFTDLNPQAAGVPWPMIFGSCAHVPALMVRRHAQAFTQCALRLTMSNNQIFTVATDGSDFTMNGNPTVLCFTSDTGAPELNVIYVDNAYEFPQGSQILIIIEDVVFQGTFSSNNTFNVSYANYPKYTNLKVGNRGTDADANNYSVLWMSDNTPIANHHCYFKTVSGKEWYNYCVRQENNKCWFRFPFRSPIAPYNPYLMTNINVLTEAYAISKCGIRDDIAGDAVLMKNAVAPMARAPGMNPFGGILQRLKTIGQNGAAWWQVPSDTEVRLWGDGDPDIYIASLSPLNINSIVVWGKRRITIHGKSKMAMCQIPASYYTVERAQYTIDGLTATGILFDPPLVDYADQQWTDDIYVTATGTIGPNPVDIIQWIITNYTDLFCDSGMFGAVRSLVTNSANFALFDKRDSIKLAEEIAFQAKCGLLVDNGGIGIVYLAVEPEITAATFAESSVRNLRLGFTERKDIITKLVSTFTTTYRDRHHLAKASQYNIRKTQRIVLSMLNTDVRTRSETQIYVYLNNVSAYYLKTREEAMYIYNDYDPVVNVTDFWGFRFSNCWRRVTFTTKLQGVRIQVFDLIVMDFEDTTLLNGAVPAIVDSIDFEPSTFTTTITATLPIVAGTFEIASGFWPG